MTEGVRVSIGRVKRDISELVNRVANGGERVVLTSRGKAKAVLISVPEYERLRQRDVSESQASWRAWLAQSDRLAQGILERRQGEPLPVDELWQAARADLEERDERILGVVSLPSPLSHYPGWSKA